MEFAHQGSETLSLVRLTIRKVVLYESRLELACQRPMFPVFAFIIAREGRVERKGALQELEPLASGLGDDLDRWVVTLGCIPIDVSPGGCLGQRVGLTVLYY